MKNQIFSIILSAFYIAPPSGAGGLYAQDSTLSALKAQTALILNLYEVQNKECRAANASLKTLAINIIEDNLKEITKIKLLITNANITLAELAEINNILIQNSKTLNTTIRKAARRAKISKSINATIIATLSALLIREHYFP